jgi:hypothetical protein
MVRSIVPTASKKYRVESRNKRSIGEGTGTPVNDIIKTRAVFKGNSIRNSPVISVNNSVSLSREFKFVEDKNLKSIPTFSNERMQGKESRRNQNLNKF